MTETLRIADVLSRNVAVEWFEAVALVREVAERVRESFAGHSVPELHQIALAVNGRVTLSGASRTDEPVRRLGQLLQAVLVQSDPPIQLRLLGSQATVPTPAFASVREFADALEYFERPDRQGILRELYARSAAAPDAHVGLTPTLDAIAPLEQQKPAKPKETAPHQRLQTRNAMPAFAAAVIIVVGGTAYWQFGVGAAPSTAQMTDLATKASDVVGTALVSGLSSVTDKVGLGRLAPAEGSSAPPTPNAPAPKSPTAAPVVAKAKSPNFRLFDLAPEVSVKLPAATLPPVPVPSIETEGRVIAEDVTDRNVYSASDPNVTAPIGVRPQLPSVLPTDINNENLSQIELLVLPDGTVGAVKLLGQPRSVIEGMLLSAAKAWKFKPAMKGDRPVAYRKLVWLVLE